MPESTCRFSTGPRSAILSGNRAIFNLAAFGLCRPCTVPTATPPAAALERRRLRPAAAATVAPHGTARLIERSQPSYEDALRASLSRGGTFTTAQLVQQAFTEEGRTCTLQRQLGLWAVADSPAAHRAGGGPPLFDADEAASTWMNGWEASPQTLPGFDTEASLGVPGLAGAGSCLAFGWTA